MAGIPPNGGLWDGEIRRTLGEQGGTTSGSLAVMLPGITISREQDPRGKGFRTSQRGALHPVESSIQDMASLPWDSSPRFVSPPGQPGGVFSTHWNAGTRVFHPVRCHSEAVWARRRLCCVVSCLRHMDPKSAQKTKKKARRGLTRGAAFRIFALPQRWGAASGMSKPDQA